MTIVRIAILLCFALPATAWGHDSICEALLSAAGPDLGFTRVNEHVASEKAAALYAPERLKVATWNMNLLNRTGCHTFNYKERSERACPTLTQYLKSERPDVLFLQEVWMYDDYKSALDAAVAAGYMAAGALSLGLSHGLQTLVRPGLSVEASGFYDFSRAGLQAFEWLGWIKRGVLWVKFRLPSGRKVFMLNTHLTPFAVYAPIRARQAERIAALIAEEGFDRDFVILGADLNIGADFAVAAPWRFEQLKKAHWLYADFARITGLRDAYRAVNPFDPGYTFNPDFDPKKSAHEFSAHQRLDYIWAAERSAGSRVHVVDAGIGFTGLLNGILPSDHYLVRATLDLFQVPNN